MNIPLFAQCLPQNGLSLFDGIKIALAFPATLEMYIKLFLIDCIQTIICFELNQPAGFIVSDLHLILRAWTVTRLSTVRGRCAIGSGSSLR